MTYSGIKTLTQRLVCIGGLSLFATTAHAEWSLGVAGISSDGSFRGIDRDTFAVPLIVPLIGYEGERVYFRGLEAGYRLNSQPRNTPPAQRSPHEWAIVVTAAPFRFRPSDSDDAQMQLLDSRSFSAELAIDYKYRTPFGVADLRAGQDIRGNGHRLSGSYAYPISTDFRRWQVSPAVGVTYISSGYTDYYYGVSAQESILSGLPEYSSQDAFNPFARVSGYYRFNESWSMFGAFTGSRLSSKIANSPMAEGRYINSVILAVSYTF
ncbi:MAG: MipA/OmpV family protein [Firmicutes bacterium]|nr:MipA/OmpV family protein [Bacillota bacterium]